MVQNRYKRPLLTLVMAGLVVASAIGNATSAVAASLTISQNGPTSAVDQNVTSATDWRLTASATALPNSDGTPANISLIFAYVDADNYSYANLSTASASYLSGIYKVTDDVPTQVLGLAAHINANTTYSMELRKSSGAVKLYINSTYLAKADDISTAATKFGVGTV